MSAHTLGPWEVVADAGQSVSPRDGYLVRWVDGLGVECDVAWVRPGLMLGAGEVRANANLIAAAPDLLEACKASVARCKFDCTHESHCGQCEPLVRAIAKATGGDR